MNDSKGKPITIGVFVRCNGAKRYCGFVESLEASIVRVRDRNGRLRFAYPRDVAVKKPDEQAKHRHGTQTALLHSASVALTRRRA